MTDDFNQVLNSSRLSIIGNFNNRDNRRETHRLDQGEHSVMGYFSSNFKAKQALSQIRDLGFEIAQLDLVNNPGADPDSASALVSSLPRFAPDTRMEGSQPYLVTVVTNPERAPEVAKIMEEHGGYV